MYSVKEIYYTLQGEGAQAGRAAVFLRFSGCNLWTGREEDRHKAVCQFCDTDFVGTDGENGGKYGAEGLASKVAEVWQGKGGDARFKYVVCTGGEPMLQLDDDACDALHDRGFEIAIETNGTKPVDCNVDWVCVSPKAGSEIVQTWGNELKLVFPQPENKPEQFAWMNFKHHFLQAKDGPDIRINMQACVDYCLLNPQWRLSIQTHKLLGIK